jgi:hypothetical protein
MSKHYIICDGDTGDGRTRITARDIHHARAQAEGWLDDYEIAIRPVDSTTWIDAVIKDCGGETLDRIVRQIDPDEPDCDDDGAHEWAEVDVRGCGGGVSIRDKCSACGIVRRTVTNATRPSDGTQNHVVVEYMAR